MNGGEVFEKVKKYGGKGCMMRFDECVKWEEKVKYGVGGWIEWVVKEGYELKVFG